MQKNQAEPTLDWKEVKRTTVFETKWMSVQSRDYQLPDGEIHKDHFILTEANGTTIIALTPDKKIITVKQFRPGLNGINYDFPGGGMEGKDADPLKTAQRELQEETGYSSQNWTHLGTFSPAPHRLENESHAFLALDCEKNASTNLDLAEFIQVELHSLEEIEEMISSSKFQCGVCITAFYKAQLYIRNNTK